MSFKLQQRGERKKNTKRVSHDHSLKVSKNKLFYEVNNFAEQNHGKLAAVRNYFQP
jgi:hypothetical protein